MSEAAQGRIFNSDNIVSPFLFFSMLMDDTVRETIPIKPFHSQEIVRERNLTAPRAKS